MLRARFQPDTGTSYVAGKRSDQAVHRPIRRQVRARSRPGGRGRDAHAGATAPGGIDLKGRRMSSGRGRHPPNQTVVRSDHPSGSTSNRGRGGGRRISANQTSRWPHPGSDAAFGFGNSLDAGWEAVITGVRKRILRAAVHA